jgi:CHASE3 domain sensor protein
VIPLEAVAECIDLPAGSESEARTAVINLRGEPVPYMRLRQTFGTSAAPVSASLVVVTHGGRRAALAVDTLVGESQVVIKPFSRLLKDLPGIAGSTILGTGRVALILDVPATSQFGSERAITNQRLTPKYQKERTVKNLKIGKRLTLAFGFVLGMMALVAAAGYWGLQSTGALATRIVTVDSPLVEHSQRARANTLGLRRYEKDYFLNIGSAEKEADYLAKWDEQFKRLDERLDILETLATGEDKDTLALMRKDAVTYEQGFKKVIELIKAGKVKTPQEANVAIADVKDEVRRLEDTAYNFAGKHSDHLKTLDAVVAQSVRSTVATMSSWPWPSS